MAQEITIIQTQNLPMASIEVNKGQIPGLPKNPRIIKNDKFNALKKSLEEDPEMLGVRELLVYPHEDKYILIGGNMRFRAMKELKFETAPCKVLPIETPVAKLRAFLLKDNSAYGEWDFTALVADFNMDELEVAAIDIPDNFLESAEDDTKEPEATEDNFDVEGNKPKNPKAKQGDIYALGEHRLICGDSTCYEDVKALFADKSCDLIVTDPPYNVDYVTKLEKLGSQKDRIKIANDNMSEQGFAAFLYDSFSNMFAAAKIGCPIYVFHASKEVVAFVNQMTRAGFLFKQMLVWVKNAFVLGRQDYQWRHEPILYGWKDGCAHYFTDARNLSTVIEDQPDLESMSKKELLQYIIDYKEKVAGVPQDVLYERRPMASDEHPTMKPVPLVGRLISNSSKKGNIVFDPFGGSGTTLIAAEQLGRTCYMVEFEPVYVDVIIKRWQELTGHKAKLIGNIKQEQIS